MVVPTKKNVKLFSEQDAQAGFKLPSPAHSNDVFDQWRDERGLDPEYLGQVTGKLWGRAAGQALNWKNFGGKSDKRGHLLVFRNEDGTVFQGKFAIPRLNKEGGLIKYETPSGAPPGFFYPAWPSALREKYGIPDGTLCWEWLLEHPEIDVVITEGAGKAIALLQRGIVAIALRGVQNWNAVKGSSELLPMLRALMPGRTIRFAFDQDVKPTSIGNVTKALKALAQACLDAGAKSIRFLVWDGSIGKGIDDYLHAGGDWDGIVELARNDWSKNRSRALRWATASMPEVAVGEENLRRRAALLKFTPDEVSSTRYLEAQLIRPGFIVASRSPLGSGKTERVAIELEQSGKDVVGVTPTISLSRAAAGRWGASLLNDQFADGLSSDSVTLCPDSLYRLNLDADDVAGRVLVIDEANVVAWTMILRPTSIKNVRASCFEALAELIQAAESVVLLDAALTDFVVAFFEALAQGSKQVWKIENQYRAPKPKISLHLEPSTQAAGSLFSKMFGETRSLMLVSDARKRMAALEGLEHVFDSKSLDTNLEYQLAMDDLEGWIEANGVGRIGLSPVAHTGVSFNKPGYFKRGFGLFCGVVGPLDILQAMARDRDADCPRHLYVADRMLPRDEFATTSVERNVDNAFRRLSAFVELCGNESPLVREAFSRMHGGFAESAAVVLKAHFDALYAIESENLLAWVVIDLKAAGHEVELVEPGETDLEGAARIEEKKLALSVSEARAILAASLVPARVVEELEAQRTRTEAERAQIARHKLEQRLPGIAKTKTWKDKTLSKRALEANVEFLIKHEKTVRALELYWLFQNPKIAKKQAMRSLAKWMGEGMVDLAELNTKWEWITKVRRSGFAKLIGREITGDDKDVIATVARLTTNIYGKAIKPTTNIKVLGGIARRMGLTMKQAPRGKYGPRVYRIEVNHDPELLACVARRFQGLRAKDVTPKVADIHGTFLKDKTPQTPPQQATQSPDTANTISSKPSLVDQMHAKIEKAAAHLVQKVENFPTDFRELVQLTARLQHEASKLNLTEAQKLAREAAARLNARELVQI